jgi:hypothetical protein
MKRYLLKLTFLFVLTLYTGYDNNITENNVYYENKKLEQQIKYTTILAESLNRVWKSHTCEDLNYKLSVVRRKDDILKEANNSDMMNIQLLNDNYNYEFKKRFYNLLEIIAVIWVIVDEIIVWYEKKNLVM